MTEFEDNLAITSAIGKLSPEQTIALAAVYTEIMGDMGAAVIKARTATSSIPNSVEGMKELKQLLRSMDSTFVKIAKRVIQKAYMLQNPQPDPIVEGI